MTVVAKKSVTSKTLPKAVRSKAPPKPKFGELGYEFKVTARIVEVSPEYSNKYPFIINIDLGKYDVCEDQSDDSTNYMYVTKDDLLRSVSKHVPALNKSIKLDELNKAKAEVARLTKELAAIK